MPEPSQLIFSFQELVTLMLKAQDIHEGIWGLFVRFALNAANIGETESDMRPTAMVPLMQIGLQRMDKLTNISVDAAKVNPKEPEKKSLPKR